jgi:hypothetical protein
MLSLSSGGTGTSRRSFLQVGALGAVGLTLPGLLERTQTRRSCILIQNLGAPSQLDLFDPKPGAPSEVRGPFSAIPTASSEIQLTELLPLHAKVADRFSLIRSVHHPAAAACGVGHPRMRSADPQTEIFNARLAPGPGLRAAVDRAVKDFEIRGFAPFQDREFLAAYELVTSSRAREAFDLGREPEATLARYGRSRIGRCCLLARRLIEAGVRLVTITPFVTVFNEISWDIHGSKPFSSIRDMKEVVAPAYDRGYSALIEDLSDRGLLESTMVAALAEFGRAPHLNAAGGRDHWPHCWTVSIAGGGVEGGRVIGRSDEAGAYPWDRPVTPGEIAATLDHSLGASASGPGPGDRPILELF